MKNPRTLKVYETYQSRDWNKHVSRPEIRLQGKWLQELSFEIGQTIQVQQHQNKLVITQVSKSTEKH
jgi:toxic protein SymE